MMRLTENILQAGQKKSQGYSLHVRGFPTEAFALLNGLGAKLNTKPTSVFMSLLSLYYPSVLKKLPRSHKFKRLRMIPVKWNYFPHVLDAMKEPDWPEHMETCFIDGTYHKACHMFSSISNHFCCGDLWSHPTYDGEPSESNPDLTPESPTRYETPHMEDFFFPSTPLRSLELDTEAPPNDQ